VELHDPVADADEFYPTALRGVVNKLLASRFDLQIQIRQPQPSAHGAR
jgi:hypothetical protein